MTRRGRVFFGAILVAAASSSGAWGQTREELARTIDLLRHPWPPAVYVHEWTEYTGFTALTQEDMRAGEAVLKALTDHYAAERPDLMLAELEAYLASSPPDELGAMALYFYFNRVVDLEGAIPSPADFDKSLPSWALLSGPNTKMMYSYVHLDQAWQARAEGKPELARAYYARLRSTAKRLMDDAPADPVQVWNVYNFMLASMALGEASVTEAAADLKSRVAAYEPCVLTWIARFQLATVSTQYESISEDSAKHLEIVASQTEADFMQAAYADPSTMQEVKAMLLVDSANAWLILGETEAARAAFDAVFSDFGSRLEWTPRRSGRTIVNPGEFGVLSMSAHNRVQLDLLDARDDATKAVTAIDGFLEKYPNSEYADDLLWAKARRLEHAEQLTEARSAYRELEETRQYSPHSNAAAQRRAAIDAELSEQAASR